MSMPCDEIMEQQIVRLLVLYPEQFEVLRLERDDFYDPQAQRMYDAIAELHQEGLPIDLLSLSEKVGAASTLADWLNQDYVSVHSGTHYAAKLRELSVARKVVIEVEKEKDPKKLIELIKGLESKLQSESMLNVTQLAELYDEKWKEKQERMAKSGAIGLVTGFEKLDQKVTMQDGNLVILAARSSIGKSGLAMNIAVNSAMFSQNVMFFSAEMKDTELMDRVYSSLTGIHATKFKYADTDSGLQRGRKEFTTLDPDRFKLYFRPYLSTKEVVRVAQTEAKKAKPDLIVVDYLQYLADPKSKNGTDEQRVAGMTRRLKALAGTLDCVVLALSQVNRQAAGRDNGMPELSDLRSSGAIEQDADIVLMLNRENRSSATAQLAIKKNRSGQADVGIALDFNPETITFTESKGITDEDVQSTFGDMIES